MKNNHNESRFKAFEIDDNKVKEYEEFLKQQKKVKEERNKLIE